ncbi:shieldin complex subunit 1 [Gastrophryne carolinensis]
MEDSGAAASQLSECSDVLDLSPTYMLTDSALKEDPCAGTWEDDTSGALASTSSEPSLSYTGCGIRHCEDNEKRTEEGDASITRTWLPSLETGVEVDDVHIRASLDAFYELSSQTGDDPFSQQLSSKIYELKQKNHLYALRSFQMAKIILNQEGTKALQNCATDRFFASTEPPVNIKPVPGISDDVVSFLMNRNDKETD